MLPAKLPVGTKVAVMECVPTMSELVVKAAVPALPRVTAWRTVPLSAKVMEPVGVPLEEVTVAVKVTVWLNVEGLREEIRAVDEA